MKLVVVCLVILTSLNHSQAFPAVDIKTIKFICSCAGIPTALLLTKIDKLGLDFNNDYTNVFKDQTVGRLVETVSEMFSVPENNVMSVKNYAQEAEVKTDVDILALLALRRLQHLALDRLELLVSPEVAADSAVVQSNMSDTA